jgi:hypothetical protein
MTSLVDTIVVPTQRRTPENAASGHDRAVDPQPSFLPVLSVPLTNVVSTTPLKFRVDCSGLHQEGMCARGRPPFSDWGPHAVQGLLQLQETEARRRVLQTPCGVRRPPVSLSRMLARVIHLHSREIGRTGATSGLSNRGSYHGDLERTSALATPSYAVGPRGLEPRTRGLTVPLRLSPPPKAGVRGLDCPFTVALARVRCHPSSLYTFRGRRPRLGSGSPFQTEA